MKTCVCRDGISYKPTEILWLTPLHQRTRIPCGISYSLLGHTELMCWLRHAQGQHSPGSCKSGFFLERIALPDSFDLIWECLTFYQTEFSFIYIFYSLLLSLNGMLDYYNFSTEKIKIQGYIEVSPGNRDSTVNKI